MVPYLDPGQSKLRNSQCLPVKTHQHCDRLNLHHSLHTHGSGRVRHHPLVHSNLLRSSEPAHYHAPVATASIVASWFDRSMPSIKPSPPRALLRQAGTHAVQALDLEPHPGAPHGHGYLMHLIETAKPYHPN